jgi:GNAT superfamily N-acetyltransferase
MGRRCRTVVTGRAGGPSDADGTSDLPAITAVTEVDLEEVVELYRSVGWSVYAERPQVLEQAIAGSSFVVTARDHGRLVGMARAVSDGASICYLQDVLVAPHAQRRGIGRHLVTAILDRYASVRQKVLLTDDEPAQRAFYESLGYAEISDFGEGSLRAFVRFD